MGVSQDKARSRMGPWRLGPELYAVSLLGSYADWLMAEAHEVHESMGHRASNQDAHQEAVHELPSWGGEDAAVAARHPARFRVPPAYSLGERRDEVRDMSSHAAKKPKLSEATPPAERSASSAGGRSGSSSHTDEAVRCPLCPPASASTVCAACLTCEARARSRRGRTLRRMLPMARSTKSGSTSKRSKHLTR